MKEHLVVHEKDLSSLAEKVLTHVSSYHHKRATVILLHGDLGAGKTAFTQSFAKILGIKEEINSPTFILKKEYKTPHVHYRKLIHIDAYRFLHEDEGKVLNLEEDLRDPSAIVAIEWPSRMKEIKADVSLSFDVIDDDTRDVAIQYEKVYEKV